MIFDSFRSLRHAPVILLLVASVIIGGLPMLGLASGHVVVSGARGFVTVSQASQERSELSDRGRHQPPSATPLPAPIAPPPFGLSMPLSGWMTTSFGNGHWAVDLAAPCGTIVFSADDGIVLLAGWGSDGGGIEVEVDHGWAVTWYDHLSSVSVVPGEVVSRGQELGQEGSTGISTGCHLHWAAAVGSLWVDPTTLLVGQVQGQ